MINYLRVFLTFARNSLVRDMTFRANFLIDMISSISWVLINVAFYTLIFHYTPTIGASTAIFGIFGALFTYSLHNRDSAVGRALSSMGTVILINLVITFVVPGISWQGHIGGLVGGVLCVEALTWFGRRDLRAPWGARDAALLAAIVAILVVAVVWRTANFPLA